MSFSQAAKARAEIEEIDGIKKRRENRILEKSIFQHDTCEVESCKGCSRSFTKLLVSLICPIILFVWMWPKWKKGAFFAIIENWKPYHFSICWIFDVVKLSKGSLFSCFGWTLLIFPAITNHKVLLPKFPIYIQITTFTCHHLYPLYFQWVQIHLRKHP